MKRVRQLCAALALTLILSLTALAGDMSCGITSTAPPQQTQAAACGDMSCGVASTDESASGVPFVTEVALGLLQSVLALF
ncbi:MAG TPA: hypothetical protein VN256_21780 [Pyrinomonadaceae bacterium]|nr:hypothetical protein [Pyrinomonadaceae bacterium]